MFEGEIIEKNKLINALNPKEIAELDKLYNKKHSSSTQRAMSIYSDNSDILNECFRYFDGNWNRTLEEKYNLLSENFENICNSLEEGVTFLKYDTRLYRGIKNCNLGDYPINKKLINKGYSSTSFDKNVAKFYAGELGCVLVIDAEKFSPGFYIRQHSFRPHEIEFLLPRDSVLSVYYRNVNKNEIFCKLQ